MRILMVCLGNICRSPMAEGVLRKKAWEQRLGWTIESAAVWDYNIGEAPQFFAQKVCAAHGIDISHKRARLFTPADFNKYDKIYALAQDVYHEITRLTSPDIIKPNEGVLDYLLNEIAPGDKSVPDPYRLPENEFIKTYDLIDRACDAIVDRYKDR